MSHAFHGHNFPALAEHKALTVPQANTNMRTRRIHQNQNASLGQHMQVRFHLFSKSLNPLAQGTQGSSMSSNRLKL
ncbi:hypothetical protein V6N12_020816 [Hibiscus sabdariffa]|uniref:Uncharacterized protein n=1 Tax=Hibiscus sabdariffa TaxID=183260 RepID=A0ABR2CZ93_9ROSI